MAKYMRLEVTNVLLETGVVPLFTHPDLKTALEVVGACRA